MTVEFVFRALDKIDEAEFERELSQVSVLENMLTEDGALIVKFWFHLTEEQQKKLSFTELCNLFSLVLQGERPMSRDNNTLGRLGADVDDFKRKQGHATGVNAGRCSAEVAHN